MTKLECFLYWFITMLMVFIASQSYWNFKMKPVKKKIERLERITDVMSGELWPAGMEWDGIKDE